MPEQQIHFAAAPASSHMKSTEFVLHFLTSSTLTLATTPPPPRGNPYTTTPYLSSYAFDHTPTIPSIDKLKGRSNYKTWTIESKSHAHNLHEWPALQGQPASEEQEELHNRSS
jgi:hypothetical protein